MNDNTYISDDSKKLFPLVLVVFEADLDEHLRYGFHAPRLLFPFGEYFLDAVLGHLIKVLQVHSLPPACLEGARTVQNLRKTLVILGFWVHIIYRHDNLMGISFLFEISVSKKLLSQHYGLVWRRRRYHSLRLIELK